MFFSENLQPVVQVDDAACATTLSNVRVDEEDIDSSKLIAGII